MMVPSPPPNSFLFSTLLFSLNVPTPAHLLSSSLLFFSFLMAPSGRAEVAMTFKKADGTQYDVDGKLYDQVDIRMVIDGFNAPLTGGNFVDLIDKVRTLLSICTSIYLHHLFLYLLYYFNRQDDTQMISFLLILKS